MNESPSPTDPPVKRHRKIILASIIALSFLMITLWGYLYSQERQKRFEELFLELRDAEASRGVEYIGPDFITQFPLARQFLPQRITGATFLNSPPSSKEPPPIEVTDDQLLHMFNNPNYNMDHFTGLTINSRKITDKGLKCIDNLPHLTWLELINTQATTQSFARIKNLHDLKNLHIWGAPLDDQGLDLLVTCIQNHKGLKQLKLENTQITDEGLVHLRRLKHIPKLLILISASNVSEEAIKDLKKYVRKSHRTKP